MAFSFVKQIRFHLTLTFSTKLCCGNPFSVEEQLAFLGQTNSQKSFLKNLRFPVSFHFVSICDRISYGRVRSFCLVCCFAVIQLHHKIERIPSIFIFLFDRFLLVDILPQFRENFCPLDGNLRNGTEIILRKGHWILEIPENLKNKGKTIHDKCDIL